MIKFPKIRALNNVYRDIQKYDHLKPVHKYIAKIKLHGTNAGVRVKSNGEVFAQSRTTVITPGDDNAGFAAWVEENKDWWSKLVVEGDITFFGEWFGQGIQKGTSASSVNGKHFAIFAIYFDDRLISEVDVIETALNIGHDEGRLQEIHVVPEFELNFSSIDYNDSDAVKAVAETINQYVADVETCDPFIKEVFGINGNGEGLVFCPPDCTLEEYEWYAFKAKGEKHKTVKQKKAVQIDPEVAESIDAFSDMVLTPARLEQGLVETGNGEELEMSRLGDFLMWISKDVKTECVDELEASNLEWKQVAKVIQSNTREWFKKQMDEI